MRQKHCVQRLGADNPEAETATFMMESLLSHSIYACDT